MFTVWSMDNCVWCTRVTELLADKGIAFTKWQPPLPELRVAMKARGFTTLPQVFDNEGLLIGGYEDTKLHLT